MRPTIEINVANFPPLSGADDTPVPTPGYKGPFQKYSADEIINIAKGVKEAKLPATLNPATHPLSMTVEANKDLLKRQRSFSIDETREQLRQGRPVQREAILPGKVDSRSLYYGDNEPSAAPHQAAHHTAAAAAPAAAKKEAPAAPAAQTTPGASKKKEMSEAKAAAAEVVDHVAAAAANLAITSPTVGEAMHMPTPQKITPSTWAAMLKSSATAAAPMDAAPARPRASSKDVKRTPAKEKAPATTGTAASGAKPKAADSKDAAPTEGRNRRKNSEGSKGSAAGAVPAKEGSKEKGDENSSVRNSDRRKAESGAASRSVSLNCTSALAK